MPCSWIDEVTIITTYRQTRLNTLTRSQISHNIHAHAVLRTRERKPHKILAILIAIPTVLLALPPICAVFSLWLLSTYGPRIPRPTRSFQPLNLLYIVRHYSLSAMLVQNLLWEIARRSWLIIAHVIQFPAMYLLALHAVKICIYLRCYNAKYWWYLRLMRLRTLVTLSAKPPVKCFSTTFSQLCFMAKLSEQNPSFDISTAMLFDSGCSQHTFFDKNSFSELRNYGPGEIVPTITGIGDTILQPTGVGTVTVSCNVNDAPQALTLRNVLYCPSLKANLISCSQLLSHDEVLITLMPHGCEVLLNQRPVAQARHQFGLFILNTWEDRALAFQSYTAHGGSNDDGSAFPAYGTTNSALEQLWHRRMGHLGIKICGNSSICQPALILAISNRKTASAKHVSKAECTISHTEMPLQMVHALTRSSTLTWQVQSRHLHMMDLDTLLRLWMLPPRNLKSTR